MNISIIGVGRLGLCMALSMERKGFKVLGVDSRQDYVDALNKKTFKSQEPQVNEYLKKAKNFKVSTDIQDALEFSNIIYVLVATPSLKNGKYDHSQVDKVLKDIRGCTIRGAGKHLIIGCTVMPGYTDEVAMKMQKYGYTVSYNPEFIAQGTIIRDQYKPDICLFGTKTAILTAVISELYCRWCDTAPKFCCMSPYEAEVTKIALNSFVTMKIAFANMVGDIICNKGGNPDTVLSAISADHRVGESCFKYGYGFGGPCFPRDNRAFAMQARRAGIKAVLSYAADQANIMHAQQQAKNIKGRDWVVDDVGYKEGSIIIEESQKLEVARYAANLGIAVTVWGTEFMVKQVREKYGKLFKYVVRK
jgi:nucleotide sugar dehydrogenase